MPIFEKPPRDTLAPAIDRWTPIYLEHGRVEVDDSSVKWIGTDRTSIICSMGYFPQLGFIHVAGTLPFVYDIADIYKPISTLEAAFETIASKHNAKEKDGLSNPNQMSLWDQLMRRSEIKQSNILGAMQKMSGFF